MTGRLIYRSLLLISVIRICSGNIAQINSYEAPIILQTCTLECANEVEKSSTEWQQRYSTLEQSKEELEKSVQVLPKQLQDAMLLVEAVKNDRDSLERSATQRIHDLDTKLIDAANQQKEMENINRDCTDAYEQLISSEKIHKAKREADLRKLTLQIEELKKYREISIQREGNFQSLKQEIILHEAEIFRTRRRLNKNFEGYRSHIRNVDIKLQKLEHKVSTTYINVIPIQEDFEMAVTKVADFLMPCWNAVEKTSAPYRRRFIFFAQTVVNQTDTFYHRHGAFHLQKFVNNTEYFQKEKIVPTLEKHISPAIYPMLNNLLKLMEPINGALEHSCLLLLHYLQLMEYDCFLCHKLTNTLEYVVNNSGKALSYILLATVGILASKSPIYHIRKWLRPWIVALMIPFLSFFIIYYLGTVS